MSKHVVEKRKILFLGETFRADAQTWMTGLKEFGNFEIITWEMKVNGQGIKRILRLIEYVLSPIIVRQFAKKQKPDMVIAERTTSYGFLGAATKVSPFAVAQQGITDTWPENSNMLFVKKWLEKRAFDRADLIHAWGKVMADTMQKKKVPMSKVMILPKGISLDAFVFDIEKQPADKIRAVVTRSLTNYYRHEIIIAAFEQLHKKGIDFELVIVGDGVRKAALETLVGEMGMTNKVVFTGRINNNDLPTYMAKSNIYISMPVTEGVSASLFEAMAAGTYPIVTNIPGNQNWIEHGKNGSLIDIDDTFALAKEIERTWNEVAFRQKAVLTNRRTVEEKANYKINMKLIADRYHQLIDQYQNKR
jgi:glycosyltransferase involved in cell wall biosynthesis